MFIRFLYIGLAEEVFKVIKPYWFLDDLVDACLLDFNAQRFIDIATGVECNVGPLKRNNLVSTVPTFEFVNLDLFQLIELLDLLNGLPSVHRGHGDIAYDQLHGLNVFDASNLPRINLI